MQQENDNFQQCSQISELNLVDPLQVPYSNVIFELSIEIV